MMVRVATLLYACVGMAFAALPEIPDAMTANNGSEMVRLVTNLNDTRFLMADPDNGPYTLIIPVDSAFQKLTTAEMNNLQSTPGKLQEVIGVHVIRGEHFSWDLRDGRVVGSANGHFIRIYNRNGVLYLNDAKVLKTDVLANGAVLVFVDTVLDAPEGTVYAVLKKPEFGLGTFASLVDATHYYNKSLDLGVGPWTVFAPSEDAFARLGDVIINQIKANRNTMRQVIEYHIHAGTLHLKSLDRNGTIDTLYQGHNIGISMTDDIRLNSVAMLEEADIDCDNGVVHIIDHVLLPSTLGAVIG